MRMILERLVCRNRRHVLCGLLLVLISIVGCTSSDGKLAAEEAVAGFHKLLNDERYGELAVDVDPKFKEVTSRQEMIDLLQTIHMRLGRVRSTKTSQGRMDSSLTETQIILIQDTEFENGQ